jgi:hypothetical protein
VPAHLGSSEATDQQSAHRGASRSPFKRIFSESGIVLLLASALYLLVGWLLDFHYLSFNWDASSRMANGFYVLYSRDPHLAAIGFVWNPGMSIADIIPLLAYHLWTPLATHAFAATLVSALCMAGAVYQVLCSLREWGVPRAARLVLTVVMGLNGMIVYYGGNGMSEGLYLFLLVASGRYMLRWLQKNDLTSLVYSAIALGLCYLVRNEAVAPALFGGLAVLAVTFLRNTSGRRRVWGALTDLIIFEIPIATTFLGWAVVSYVITGQPFPQFESIYGNSSQEKLSSHLALHARITQDLHAIFYMAPTIPVILIVAAVLAIRRRDIGILAPLTIVGGGAAFDLLAYLTNEIQPFFRYFIALVPLEVLLVGGMFATAPALLHPIAQSWPAAETRTRAPARKRPRTFATVAVLLALCLAAPSLYTTVKGMFNPKVGVEESGFLGFIVDQHQTAGDKREKQQYPALLSITNYLAKQHLASGQVIVDNFSACIPFVIVMSPNPDIFVIPNDRSFQRTLADPLTFHAHYILDADPNGIGSLTAPNISYPALWKTGAGFATEVHYFPSRSLCPAFKLFRITGHPNQA